MADMTVSGLEEFTQTLWGDNGMDFDTEEEILLTGADIIVDNIRKEMAASRFDIEKLSKAVRSSGKVKRDRHGDPYITVTVGGKTATGERNATVAFVLNYGRSKKYGEIQGGYFWTKAVRNAEDDIAEMAYGVLGRKLRERGLE